MSSNVIAADTSVPIARRETATSALAADCAVAVRDLGKRYRIFARPKDRLKQMLFGRWKSYFTDFWALTGVSFDVPRGSTFGVIGSNGSGKSTLLQILAGILPPSVGTCERRGRTGALIELGAGFNAEFTGAENASMQCALLGLPDNDTTKLLVEIQAFAGIGDFFHRPIKTYSSGMAVRLAFACQALLEPDILLADEILAVGDQQFQWKCFARIKALRERGSTIMLVTHDTTAVLTLCDKVLWLDSGKIMRVGNDVPKIVAEYLDFQRRRLIPERPAAPKEHSKDQIGLILSVEILDARGEASNEFKRGDAMTVRVRYELKREVPNCVLGVAIFNSKKEMICGLNTQLDKIKIPHTPGTHTCELQIPGLPLVNGDYHLDCGLLDELSLGRADYQSMAANFRVGGAYDALGFVVLDHSWKAGG